MRSGKAKNEVDNIFYVVLYHHAYLEDVRCLLQVLWDFVQVHFSE